MATNSASAAARKSLSGAATLSLVRTMEVLLSSPTVKAAIDHAKLFSPQKRKALAQLAGLEAAWVGCDQAIESNVADLCEAIVDELYTPFWFFRGSLRASYDRAAKGCRQGPRGLFEQRLATRAMTTDKGYWGAKHGLAIHDWLPSAGPLSGPVGPLVGPSGRSEASCEVVCIDDSDDDVHDGGGGGAAEDDSDGTTLSLAERLGKRLKGTTAGQVAGIYAASGLSSTKGATKGTAKGKDKSTRTAARASAGPAAVSTAVSATGPTLGPATFDAVVHFVQAGSGTGVHVGGGLVLTCAHVVDARDDDSDDDADDDDKGDDDDNDDCEGAMPARVGRRKVVIFPSGDAFLTECCAAVETANGEKDVAVLVLGPMITVGTPGSAAAAAAPPAGLPSGLPSAAVADDPALFGDRLFCVGNPARVSLEGAGDTDFEPPAWHASAGNCLGYATPAAEAALSAQAGRGRAPTRGERKAAAEAQEGPGSSDGYLWHSCWTYWGHSGAPLFAQRTVHHASSPATSSSSSSLSSTSSSPSSLSSPRPSPSSSPSPFAVAGLHCAWHGRSGMRQGQQLKHIHAALTAALQPRQPRRQPPPKGSARARDKAGVKAQEAGGGARGEKRPGELKK